MNLIRPQGFNPLMLHGLLGLLKRPNHVLTIFIQILLPHEVVETLLSRKPTIFPYLLLYIIQPLVPSMIALNI